MKKRLHLFGYVLSNINVKENVTLSLFCLQCKDNKKMLNSYVFETYVIKHIKHCESISINFCNNGSHFCVFCNKQHKKQQGVLTIILC